MWVPRYHNVFVLYNLAGAGCLMSAAAAEQKNDKDQAEAIVVEETAEDITAHYPNLQFIP